MVLKKVNCFEKNNAITLVSLVITIVVMLILAGVTLNLVIGNNGLFGKSKDSASKYSEAAIKEELQTASNGAYVTENNGEVTNEMIANDMNQNLKGIVWQDESMLAGNYKGYDFYIDDDHNVVMEKLDVKVSEIENNNNYNLTSATKYAAYREQIKNINILVNKNFIIPTDVAVDKQWDVSKDKDRSIIAYLQDTGNNDSMYNLYIVGVRKITLPELCTNFFNGYINVDTINGIQYLDASKVTDMQYMFMDFGKNSLQELNFGSNFNTNNVKKMDYMFTRCGRTALKSLILCENGGTGFNTSNVTMMTCMFEECGHDSLETFNIGPNFDTSKVQSTQSMFEQFGYTKLKELNLGDKFNTSNVTNMCIMFRNCGYTAMTTLKLGNHFNTAKVQKFHNMFENCGYTALTGLSLGNEFSTESTTSFTGFMYKCGNLAMTSLDLGAKFTVPSGLNTDKSFTNTGNTACVIDVSSTAQTQVYNLTSPKKTMNVKY